MKALQENVEQMDGMIVAAVEDMNTDNLLSLIVNHKTIKEAMRGIVGRVYENTLPRNA